jgi:cyclohexyl-isocyanide hydratase
VAQAMQLLVEYAPAPPFDAGSPERAPPALVDFVNAQIEAAFPQPKTYFANKDR